MVVKPSPSARSSGSIFSFALAVLLAALTLIPSLGPVGARGALAQAAAVEDNTATVTPADALVYTSINLDTKSSQFTLAADLLKRAGLTQEVDSATSMSASEQEAIDAVTGGYAAFVLTSLSPEILDSLDTAPADLTTAASDPTALAEGGVPSGFAVILQSPDPDAAMAELMKDIESSSDAGTAKVVKDTYEGVEITSVPATSSDEPGTAIARVGDFVVLATLPEDIHPIIDTQKGTAKSLADSDELSSVKDELNAEWLAFGLVNGPGMLDAIEAAGTSTADEIPASTKAQLEAVTGFVFWADQPGFRMDTISIASEQAATPVATPAVKGDLASKVPADSLIFANGMNINQYGVLDAIGLVFAQALVGSDMSMATPTSMGDQEAAIYAQAASVLGFNLKTDFIDQLEGEYGFALSASDLTSGSPKVDAIFVTDTVNAQKVTDVASKISFILAAAIDGDMMSSREVGGSTVTTLNLGDASTPLKVEYGVVDGQLLIGVNDGIDTYVSGPANPLSDSPLYMDTLAQLPGDPTGISFVNLEQIVPLVAEAESALGGASSVDASPDCAKFATQAEAQAAYDEDSFTNFDLDQDFDGKACEDFFVSATAEASPTAAPMSGLRSVGMVSYEKDGHQATSTIILIVEQ
jgi:hypothetical protein